MTIENDIYVRSIVAAADLRAEGFHFKAVTLNGTVAGANQLAAGILRTGNVASGHLSVVYSGLTKALVGGAVSTVGFPLKITTSGFLIACASGDTSIGRLGDRTASSGDLAEVSVDFKTFGYFGG